jgi:dCTP deaminase
MILSDKTIQHKLQTGDIVITPSPTLDQIQPASIDLKLGNEFLLPHIDQTIDVKNASPRYEPLKCNVLQLPPKAFVLGTTIEKVKLPSNLIGRVEGRSSIGRLGVAIHITAGFIDCGFEGQITLEIANLSHNPIMLYENMRICQIVFEEVDTTPNRTYGEAGNKYQGQTGVTGSLIYYDNDTNNFGVE